MRLVHLSDTHLGYGYGTRLSERGINQREEDAARAFDRAIAKAIELRPDLVIHSGDLFDCVRPNNRTTDIAMERVRWLSEAGIETILISGNHSTPRLRETGSIFSLFDPDRHNLPGVHPVYRGAYEVVEVGDAMIHCLPHSFEPLAEANKALPCKGSLNIMTLHAGIDTIKEFQHSQEFNEQVLPESVLYPDMDYIALGHYHRSVKVRGNAYYAGSTERFSFHEAKDQKVYLEVEIGGSLKVRQHPVEGVRPMLDLKLDCAGLDAGDVRSGIDAIRQSNDISEALVRLVLMNVRESSYKSLNLHGVKDTFSDAMLFKIEPMVVSSSGAGTDQSSVIRPLLAEWEEFMHNQAVPYEKKRIVAMGREYLEKGNEDVHQGAQD
jgi:hypothetical protein